MKPSLSRRHFIKTTATGLLGTLALVGGGPIALLRTRRRGQMSGNGASAPQAELAQPKLEEHHWGFVVDTEQCIGCGKCVMACKLENDVPLDHECYRTWVERYVISEEGETFVDSPEGGINGFEAEEYNERYKDVAIRKSFFVPKLCNQCENPPCVQVCPVGATYSTHDGVILVDRDRCVGCRYCIQACPYGARFLDPRFRVADKCTWCYHRITTGRRPACVDACPVGARVFGDLDDPHSTVSKVLTEKRVSVLKGELGTEPKVRYVGLEQGVR